MPSQLIHLRQRIKAIESIKKITHAMRLISMSTHTRLKHKKDQLAQYKNSFLRLSSIIKQTIKNARDSSPTSDAATSSTKEHIVILISSQKGLCGTFNENLFRYFAQQYKQIEPNQQIITVGTYAAEFIKREYKREPFAEFNKFGSLEFVHIAQNIADIIIHQNYPHVTVYSNISYSFFSQKPQETIIFPLPEQATPKTDMNMAQAQDYLWEQAPQELELTVQNLTLLILLEELLFDSLFAEQAARFLSMDGATRNADTLLTSTKLEYNKIRQAAITRELTELSSGLDS